MISNELAYQEQKLDIYNEFKSFSKGKDKLNKMTPSFFEFKIQLKLNYEQIW